MLVGLGIRSAIKEHTAATWPSTQGVIQTATIRIDRTPRGDIQTPVIFYSYQVNGRPYGSDRVSFHFGNVIALTPNAASVVATYPEGAGVTVYYNPHDPSEAVLEPGRYANNLATVALGVFVLVACRHGYKTSLKQDAGRLTSG